MGNNIQRIKMHALHSACWKTTTSGSACLLNCIELYSNTNSSTIRYSVDYMFPSPSTDIMGNSQRFNDWMIYLHQHRIRCHDPTITFSDEMYNEALIAIEDLCIVIANLPLSNFGMNSPNRTASDLMNTEMNRELQYSTV
ncbi:uncharacterized protein TNCV_5070391 [Trichonephila clavipes]|nr:uncharacterized protein TNCV_5070391 [Trichonephila clavipes]